VIQAMVAEAGFDMKIQVQEHATRGVNMQKGDFEAGFAFWSGRIDPDGNIGNHMTCNGAQNDSRYCNEKVDKLIDDARQVADPAERKKHYDAATAQLLEDRPILFLWHRMVITAHSAKLQGFAPNPDGIIRVQGMKLDTAS
jgi:peptide/nickel transport system substrate-binding protein